ncbi:glycerol-3-phosphate acyltransferase [Lactobacillus sp. ESL0684]|uniref:glycerol-3-phosphate acyltransferase n=1 Tax=Lactobacillus sp. ESL0684 TaxID=2983213 RepID=UPI0023F77FED|nr:glycerol-3-phosphate acyltransferase [Lactobacillus sp. ESL0684]WEV44004.1 glycerol-3-phosphate acyltransferase [Lactobacillus sp. ESL0684]
MAHFWALIIGYLFGNLLFAMLVGRFWLHQDPTKVGSGNPGTANVGAVFGKKWGIITCIGDVTKSIAALLIVHYFLPGRLNLLYTGLGLVLGHCFPIWNHFQGGKGVTIAAILTISYDLKAGALSLLVALLLMIWLKNLTIPPLTFMLLFTLYEFTQFTQAGVVLAIITLVMGYKFRFDLRDFFTGQAKRVDVLTTVKKKLGQLME